MNSQKVSYLIVLGATFLFSFAEVGWGAVLVGEKREMPIGQMGYGSGSYSGGYDQGAYGGGPGQSQPGYAAPPALQPQYGPTSYTNPGFSVQTGFEGFLVPNSWYGLLPWGVEGVVVVIVGVIVFIVISVVIVGLLAWLTGFGDYGLAKEGSFRSLLPSRASFEVMTDVTNTVLDALDKYDEIQVKKNK